MYVVCLCKGCDGCCVFICIETRGAVGARVWVFRHADVVCLCLAAVLNAALYMTYRSTWSHVSPSVYPILLL